MTEDNGLSNIEEYNKLITNIKTHVSDLDVSSAYPNASRVTNLSGPTTHRELVKIEGIEKDKFKLHNIDIMFGNTNSLEYCQQMFKMPDLYKLKKEIVEAI